MPVKRPGSALSSGAGREQIQLDAAGLMRDAAGISATDKLLGLHPQPTIAGAIAAPPRNTEETEKIRRTTNKPKVYRFADRRQFGIRRKSSRARDRRIGDNGANTRFARRNAKFAG